MNDERSDDDFEGIEPLYAEPDERPGYRRPGANAAAPDRPAPARGTGWRLLTLVALLAVAALGGLAWHQQQRLQELSAEFTQLSAMLDSTGETLNQSGASLSARMEEQQTKLDTHWTEIKKLWALANERNRSAIEAQGKQLTQLEAELKKLRQEMGQASASAREASAAAAAVKTQIAGLQTGVAALQRDGLAASATLNELQGQLDQARTGVARLDEQLRSVRDSVASSTAENRKALASIDSFRRETNLQLQVLREQLTAP